MLKEEMITNALKSGLKNEKLDSYIYASDLRASNIWVWIGMFIFIVLAVIIIDGDMSIWLCALVGGIIGGYTGYNQPTYIGITNKGNLLICKVKLDNKTPRFIHKFPIKELTNLKHKLNEKSGKNIISFEYNNKKYEYIYYRKVLNKNLSNQCTNVEILNNALNNK